MSAKIIPTRKNPRFKKFICNGRLRVDVTVENDEVTEVILLPEKGGCRFNLQLIGRLITGMLSCNISLDYILSLLDENDPCSAPMLRAKRENLNIGDVGVGGCAKVIKRAIEEKVEKLQKKKDS